MALTPERRQQLDGIVQKMASQNATSDEVHAVVNDFLGKYGAEIPTVPKDSAAYAALPTKARSTASFLPGEIGRAGEAAYEGFKGLPVVKQFGQAVGLATGAVGGAVGGTIGAVGGAGEALAKGKPVLPTMIRRAGEIGSETAKFGYGVGKEAAPAAIAGAGGKLIQAPMATMQVSSGIGKLQEGDIFGGITDIGMGALSGHAAIKEPGLLVSDSLKNLGVTTPEKALKLKGEAQDLMYEVIRPTAGEIKKYEVRQGKDLHEVAGFMAKEKMTPEVDSTKKLNWTTELEKQKQNLNQENRQLQGILESHPGKTDLLSVREKAHAVIDERFANAKEAEDAKAAADELLNAEVSKYGTLSPTIKDANRIKSGMWGVGYDATKPLKSRVARILGHEIATDVKGQAGREAQKILDTMGKRLDAISLMENSTGRVVKGGRMGTYVARLLGGMAGHVLGPVGVMAGEHIAGVASEAAQKAGPIMAAKRAAGLMTKAEKAFSPLDVSLARGPGAAGAEMVGKGMDDLNALRQKSSDLLDRINKLADNPERRTLIEQRKAISKQVVKMEDRLLKPRREVIPTSVRKVPRRQ